MAKVCAENLCPQIAIDGPRCPEHAAKYLQRTRRTKREYSDADKSYDKRRGNRHARGYDSRWDKARQTFLSRNPWCVQCTDEGKRVKATAVDHRIPHNGDQKRFWDTSNWQGLCHPHHNRKTARDRVEGRLVPPVAKS